MIVVYDNIGKQIRLETAAKRIISLVPSITELLYDLGLEEKIIGRTKFCIFPEILKSIPKVGGTKSVHIDVIHSLNPDLILANKEENTKEIIDELEKSYPVYTSNIQTVHAALDMILDIGRLTDTSKQAEQWVEEIEKRRLKFHQKNLIHRTCLYLIWQNPFMTIGRDTFIFQMLQEIQIENNVFDFRYPELAQNDIQTNNAEYLFLSDEPFPFKEKHKKELSILFPNKKIILVDGSYFSWYGSRLLKAYDYFDSLLTKL